MAKTAVAEKNQVHAIELLEKDHVQIRKYFKQLEALETGNAKGKEKIFKALHSLLEIHSLMEEKILYEALKAHEETRFDALESVEEHNVAKKLLLELASMPMDCLEWDAKLKVLRESLEHHIEEEESELFVEAQSVLSKRSLDNIGKQMEAEQRKMEATVI